MGETEDADSAMNHKYLMPDCTERLGQHHHYNAVVIQYYRTVVQRIADGRLKEHANNKV